MNRPRQYDREEVLAKTTDLFWEKGFEATSMSGTLARIEYWEKEIEAINEGTPQVVLGRAREMLAHARWRAEREFPNQWGGHKLNINIGERSAPTTSDVLLEKEAKDLVALIAVVG